MPLHSASSRAATLLIAACWLVTGPAVVPIRALIECEHQRHAHHQHHGAPAVPEGPCFCGDMGSVLDVELPPALNVIDVPAPISTVTPIAVRFPLPASLLPRLTPAPEPPPPNPVA